jgi:TP901 family phage tail tape measure protein
MELEDASTTLKNSLMAKDGSIPAVFESINKQAIQLGNELPGTTKDFANIATILKNLSVDPDVIAGGALKASAYLALTSKDVGVVYDNAALAVGKLGNSFNLANDEFVPFTDAMQRVLHNGTNLEDLMYSMIKPAAFLDVIGIKGKAAYDGMFPLVSAMSKKGLHGEEISSGLGAIFEQVAKHHPEIKSVEDIINVLDGINKLPEARRMAILTATKEKGGFGEHWAKAAMITKESFEASKNAMAAQGDMMQKVGNITNQLSTKVGSLTGTWEGLLAIFGGVYSEQLKGIVEQLNSMAERMGKFVTANSGAIAIAGESIAAFAGVKLACWGVAAGIGLITAAMKTNPLMILAQVAAMVAPLVVENWGTIENCFKTGVQNIVNFFQPLIDTLQYVLNWVTNSNFLKLVGDGAIGLANSVGSLLPNLPDLSAPVGQGMRAPGYSGNGGNSFLSKGGDVRVKVDFGNAPQGMRVSQEESRGPVRPELNVGYRSLSLGMP